MISIHALKYPNILHYEWSGDIIERTSDYLLVLCKPGTRFTHHTRGTSEIKSNAWLEFFPLNDWYTVSMELNQGKIVSYYCNIALPPVFIKNRIQFIDLDLDIVKGQSEEEWNVVDEEEFEINRIKYNYSSEMIEGAVNALKRLKEKIKMKEFPFNDEVYVKLENQQIR
ncbi:DUF402 domain-containing protein [Heyndrickxia sporothermodurans]